MKELKLLEALGEVGDDLLTMAETEKFSDAWKKWLSLAAVLALVLCLGTVSLSHVGFGASEAPEAAPEEVETAPEPLPEAGEEAADHAVLTGYFTFDGRDYRIRGVPQAHPGDLGACLGVLEDQKAGPDLIGCAIYEAVDSADLWVETPEGYLQAIVQ